MNINGNRFYSYLVLGIAALAVLSSGCTTVQSFPDKARAGDTITLSVGSADGLTTSNTTVSYVSDADPFNPIDLTPNIRAITKIYPDRTSEAWVFDDTFLGNIPTFSSHGPWESVVVIDLPSVMPVSTGKVQVTTSAVYPTTAPHVNGTDISLEITALGGSPNTFDFLLTGSTTGPGDLSQIEPLPQVILRQPVGESHPKYGAIKVRVNTPILTSAGGVVPNSDVRVVADDMGSQNLASQRSYIWRRSGNNVIVNFISPLGMEYYESRFSIVFAPGTQVTSAPTITALTYYDLDGVEIPGPTPVATFE